MKSIILSSEARRKIGGTFVPRQRQPGEATAPDQNLFDRPILTASDFGAAAYVRPGADHKYPSLGPFRGDSI